MYKELLKAIDENIQDAKKLNDEELVMYWTAEKYALFAIHTPFSEDDLKDCLE